MTRRTNRVGEQFREVLSELIAGQVKDPRIGFITITAVRVSPDLAKAYVYYTVLGSDEERAQTQKGLESAAPFLRTAVGHQVRMRKLPQLVFHYDDTIESGLRIDALIREIHKDDPVPAPDDDDETADTDNPTDHDDPHHGPAQA